MSRLYCQFRAGVAALLAGGAGLCMALLFAIILVNALMRYFLGSSLSWGGQLPIFLGIYGVMFGIALAYLQDRHVRLGLLVDYLPQRTRQGLMVVVDLSVVVLGALLILSGIRFVESRGGMRVSGLSDLASSLSSSTGMTLFEKLAFLAPYQFAMVLGGVLLLLAGLLRLIDRLLVQRASASPQTSQGGT